MAQRYNFFLTYTRTQAKFLFFAYYLHHFKDHFRGRAAIVSRGQTNDPCLFSNQQMTRRKNAQSFTVLYVLIPISPSLFSKQAAKLQKNLHMCKSWLKKVEIEARG